jgi:hypothetical protein
MGVAWRIKDGKARVRLLGRRSAIESVRSVKEVKETLFIVYSFCT